MSEHCLGGDLWTTFDSAEMPPLVKDALAKNSKAKTYMVMVCL